MCMEIVEGGARDYTEKVSREMESAKRPADNDDARVGDLVENAEAASSVGVDLVHGRTGDEDVQQRFLRDKARLPARCGHGDRIARVGLEDVGNVEARVHVDELVLRVLYLAALQPDDLAGLAVPVKPA